MSYSLLNKILSSPTASTPASNRVCNNSNNDDNYDSSSYFQRTVCLYDWWLVKAEKEFQGKRLAVAGYTSRELQAMRVFTSAAIVNRYDVFTLETADGICIVLKGFINKSRTIENGFSTELFSHFVFGFPSYWEAYTEKLLGKEVMTQTGSARCPDFNQSAAVSEPVAGMANSSSTTTPCESKRENDKRKHNFEDVNEYSENLSERITINVSKGLDSTNHTAEHGNIDNAKDHTSENLPPLISCVLNTISSLEDNLAVLAEPSSHHVTNAVSGESPVLKDSDNLNPSTLDADLPVPQENLDPQENLEMEKENGGNKGGLNCRNKNCSTACLCQDSEAIERCAGEKSGGVESSYLLSSSLGVMHKDSLPTSPIVGVPNIPVSGNCIDDTMIFPVLHSAIKMNSITPSQADTTGVNITASNSGYRKTGCDLRNLISKQKEELMSEVSELLDGENLERCSSQGTIDSGRKTDKLEASLNQSMCRITRELLGNSKGKFKERVKVVCGLEAERNERNSVSLNSGQMSNIVRDDTSDRMSVFNPRDDDLQDLTRITRATNNLKQRPDYNKVSATGTPGPNLNKLAQSPSGQGMRNHQSNLRSAVGEKERNAKEVGSSRKKAQRKINFDTHASPVNQERKEKISVVSPESLSLKRSRSGRLLLPSLDFWRNQIAVYDADRKITGIQEEIIDAKPSRGSKSERRTKRRFRT